MSNFNVFKYRLGLYHEMRDFIKKNFCFEGKPRKYNNTQETMLKNMCLYDTTITWGAKKTGKSFVASDYFGAKLYLPRYKRSKCGYISKQQENSNELIDDFYATVEDSPNLKELKAIVPFDEENIKSVKSKLNGTKIYALVPKINRSTGGRLTDIILDEMSEYDINLGRNLYYGVLIGMLKGETKKWRRVSFHGITNGGYQEGFWWDIWREAESSVPLFDIDGLIENQHIVKEALASHFELDWVPRSDVLMNNKKNTIDFKFDNNVLRFKITEEENKEINVLCLSGDEKYFDDYINDSLSNEEEILQKKYKNKVKEYGTMLAYEDDKLVIYNATKNPFKYMKFKQIWSETGRYTGKDIKAFMEHGDGEGAGASYVDRYYRGIALPVGFKKFDLIAISRNIYPSSEVGYIPGSPTWVLIDPGRLQHKCGIIVIQENVAHYNKDSNRKQFPKYDIIDRWCDKPEKYKEAYDIAEGFFNKYNSIAFIIDRSNEVAFTDEMIERVGKSRVIPKSFQRNRDRFFTVLKSMLESVDEEHRGRLRIPDDFTNVIDALKNCSIDGHFPDLAASLMLIEEIESKNTGHYRESETLFVTRELELDSLGITI